MARRAMGATRNSGIGLCRARVQDAGTAKSGTPEEAMTHNDLDPLILDLLEWIARETRCYADVIEAWRTSCPRLTVWEDAVDRGYAVREYGHGRDVLIRLTADGRAFLRQHGRIVGESPSANNAAGSRGTFRAAGVRPPRSHRCAA
jgi:hypothetical protein